MKLHLSSILYVITAVFILALLDVLLYYFILPKFYNLFVWFNSLGWIIKTTAFIFAGAVIFLFSKFVEIVQLIGIFISRILLMRFHPHRTAKSIVYFICFINLVMSLILTWRMVPYYSFWMVCELLLLSVFVWSMNQIILPEHINKLQKLHQENY
jgi:hypothetical protein